MGEEIKTGISCTRPKKLKENLMNRPDICGAKTRSGTPCKRGPVPGKTRCKLHGGMSTGPRTDAGKAASALGTHGIYAAALNPEEVEAVTQADDTLANELLVARVQLRRALQSWDTWSAGVPEELPADEHTSVQDDRGKAVTIRRRRPDLWGIIDRCLGRVGRLVEQRARVEEVRDLHRQVQELTERLEEN